MTAPPDLPTRWSGPVLLSYGFRPFFLAAACWAAVCMSISIALLAGKLSIPTAFDPVSWHAHELLFGYLGAVLAGFLLTAVPNWTGRPPVLGWPLGALALLWLIGRAAIFFSAYIDSRLVAGIDLSFLLVLSVVITREILAGRNWRNLMIVGLLILFLTGNATFHWEASQGAFAAGGAGLRLALGASILMVAVIGGRIVPAFTRNWLSKHGVTPLPPPPMQRFDVITLIALLCAVMLWTTWPEATLTGAVVLLTGVLHVLRLLRWDGSRTISEPLVTILHVGYFFLPMGCLALGIEILWPGTLGTAPAKHLWMAGAVGVMTLAVMTRATLGHTGQALQANPQTIALYVALLLAVLTRVAAGIWVGISGTLHLVSGAAWIVAFGGFVLIYGPLLLRQTPPKAS